MNGLSQRLIHLPRFLHTVRHLTLRQMLYRLYYRIRPLPPAPRQPAIATRPLALVASPRWAERHHQDDGRFTFMERTAAREWNDEQGQKIWLYNLHYLDDLSVAKGPLAPGAHDKLIEAWINGNPYGKGVGWEPYPLSLRIVNLVRYFSGKGAVPQHWVQSIYQQAFSLSRQVEFHILANHLFANAKALVFAGCYLQGGQAADWLSQGLGILRRELPRQFLNDGGHFERSAMYHAVLLWDMCDLLALAHRDPRVAALRGPMERIVLNGLAWSRAMAHPDGELAFFNDACLGIAPPLAELERYAALLGLAGQRTQEDTPGPVQLRWLGDSGFASLTWEPGMKALLNLADKFPRFQPGHAHADTLSFELSLHGQRLIVNSGISEYGEGPLRQRQRGTAAHSTVQIDGADSSQVWAGFRVGRRARVLRRERIESNDTVRVVAQHDGYKHLFGGAVHERQWLASPGTLVVRDSLAGAWRSAVARYYLAPGVQAQVLEGQVQLVTAQGHRVAVLFNGHRSLSVDAATWFPGFGKAKANRCIVVEFGQADLEAIIQW